MTSPTPIPRMNPPKILANKTSCVTIGAPWSKKIDIDNIDKYTKGRNEKTKKDISHSFSFTYNRTDDEDKINCILKSEYVEESLILSRDNFINEYYTK